MTEEATWREDVAIKEKPAELVEINEKELTEFERDRLWNKMNSNVGLDGVRCLVLQGSS